MYGKHVHEAVGKQGKRVGNYHSSVNEKYDEGAILFQASVSLEESDSPETVAKIHELEQKYFPSVIEKVIKSVN